ncbi:MAG: hypothetical protein AB7J28_07225 [Hyphomonadaceae bacterium]
MRGIDTTIWTGVLALVGVGAIAGGFLGEMGPALIAAGCVACATPVFAGRLLQNRSDAAVKRERDRLAKVDRQIVAAVIQHAELLERRKAQLEAALDRAKASAAWERDLVRFHARFVAPALAPLRRAETEEEIVCRVQLAADEILALRSRVSRRAAA